MFVVVTSFYRTQAMSSFLFSSYLLHFNCKFVPLYISSLSPVLTAWWIIYPTHHLKRLYDCLFTCYLIVWCIPCAWSGDRTSVVVTTVVVTPTQSCVQLPGLLSSASFDGGNRSDNGLVGTIPCQVDTYKNENTIFGLDPDLKVSSHQPKVMSV